MIKKLNGLLVEVENEQTNVKANNYNKNIFNKT